MSKSDQNRVKIGAVAPNSASGRSRWSAPQITKLRASDANVGTRPNNADGQFATS